MQIWRGHVEDGVKDQANENDSSNKMTPNIDAFIVYHKQTFQQFLGRVKVDAVPTRYKFIVNHETWNMLYSSNEGLVCTPLSSDYSFIIRTFLFNKLDFLF